MQDVRVPLEGPAPPQIVYQQRPQPPTVHVTRSGPLPSGAGPVCHSTLWLIRFPLLAWVAAIVFFPLGLLCCLFMTQKVCSKCGLRSTS